MDSNITDKHLLPLSPSFLALGCFQKQRQQMSRLLYQGNHNFQHKDFWDSFSGDWGWSCQPSRQHSSRFLHNKEYTCGHSSWLIGGFLWILSATAVLHLSASLVLQFEWKLLVLVFKSSTDELLSVCVSSSWCCSVHGAGTPISEPLLSQTTWLVWVSKGFIGWASWTNPAFWYILVMYRRAHWTNQCNICNI